MKKSLLLLTAALTFGSMASAQTTAPASAPQVPALTDVPAGHWAKDAIDKLVSRGIILGYPDGTYRGTQNLTRYEAAVIIARLLDQMRQGTVTGIDSETLTSLQNAIQELAADLAALGVRVTDLEENAVSKDDFARLEQRVEAIGAATGDPEAIANIQAQIDELTARADEYDTLRADIDDNASSIAALNDLTVLLNQDILDLQDRVSAAETATADLVTRVDGIDTRVTKLENAPKFSIGASLNPNYGRLLSNGANFDVDRLTANTTQSASNGGFGDTLVYTADTNRDYTAESALTFGIKASNLVTANGAMIVNTAELNFGVRNAFSVFGGTNTGTAVQPVYVTLSDASASGTFAGQKFDVKYSANSSTFKFQNYLFNNRTTTSSYARRGIVANIATTLPGNPSLTIVAGNTNYPHMTGQPSTMAANYYGLRAAYNPTNVGTFGVSYAQVDGFRSALGTDFNVKFGPIALVGEGVVSVPSTLDNNIVAGNLRDPLAQTDGAGYVEARADLGMIKFGANVRAINPAFAISATNPGAINAGMSYRNDYPYAANQVGYGAALGTTLGPVALGAYVDSYTPWIPAANGADRVTGFGVKAGAQLGALELVAFYNSVTEGNNGVDGSGAANYATDNAYMYSDYDNNVNSAGMGIANVPFAMTSTFGGQLSHDGTADNALIKNLNFTIGDAYFYRSGTNSLYVYGDYSANLGGFTINPLFRYRLVTDSSTAAAARTAVDNPATTDVNERNVALAAAGSTNFNTLKYGVKIASPTLTSVPFQPSMYFNFANRISNVGNAMGVQANGTTTELLGQVGINLNDVFSTGVSAKVGYSYYQGFGVSPTLVGASDASGGTPFDASDDRLYSTRSIPGSAVKLDGIYTQIGWNGLAANYGVFKYTDLNTNTTSIAQGFKVGYTFKF